MLSKAVRLALECENRDEYRQQQFYEQIGLFEDEEDDE